MKRLLCNRDELVELVVKMADGHDGAQSHHELNGSLAVVLAVVSAQVHLVDHLKQDRVEGAEQPLFVQLEDMETAFLRQVVISLLGDDSAEKFWEAWIVLTDNHVLKTGEALLVPSYD